MQSHVNSSLCSGVARAFSSGRVAHPEGQNEEENNESLRKIRKNNQNLKKNEESGTLAHPGM